jgi:hypothetical protein
MLELGNYESAQLFLYQFCDIICLFYYVGPCTGGTKAIMGKIAEPWK